MIYEPMTTNYLEIEFNLEIHARLHDLHQAITERLKEVDRMWEDGNLEITYIKRDYSQEIAEIMYGGWKDK